MFASDMVLVGGIGYVVPVGGLEITGVLELVGSLVLQLVNKIRTLSTKPRCFTRRRKAAKKDAKSEFLLRVSFAPLRLCVKDLFSALIFDSCALILFLRNRLAGHTIFALDPTAEIYQLAPFCTEGTERILFPLDWLTAGWTLHES